MNEGEGVHHAVWTESLYLSRAFCRYMNSGLHDYAFRAVMESATSPDEIREACEKLQKEFAVGADLGYRQLLSSSRSKNHDIS